MNVMESTALWGTESYAVEFGFRTKPFSRRLTSI